MSPTKHLPSFILLGSFSLRSQTTHFNQFCGSPEHPFLPPLFPSLERKEPFVFEICCLPSNWSQNLTPKLAQSCCTGPWHVLLCSTFVDSMVNWFHCHSAFTIWKSLLIFHRNLSSRNVSLFDSILPSRAAGNNFGSPKQRYQKHQLQQIVKPIAIFTIKKMQFLYRRTEMVFVSLQITSRPHTACSTCKTVGELRTLWCKLSEKAWSPAAKGGHN